MLAGVPEADARRLLSIARRRTFGRGEIVFHEGDPADALHFIHRGRFAIRRRTTLGDDALLAIFGPGDAFGELALVSAAPRSATAYALEASETLCVARSSFDELRARHAAVDRTLVALLANELTRMNELLTEAYYVSADKRVLRRVLELARAYAADEGETAIPLTQEQVAALAGTSRATVNAVLSAERGRGLVALRRGAIIVRDRDALARRAGVPA
jgi:CRP/FNR family transcriptional regulator, cyclic AMP receptor protein